MSHTAYMIHTTLSTYTLLPGNIRQVGYLKWIAALRAGGFMTLEGVAAGEIFKAQNAPVRPDTSVCEKLSSYAL